METTKKLIIEKLIAKGYTEEQATGFILALQDTDLARQVNELTNTLVAVTSISATELLL
jgi:hypothetical protein